MFYLSAYYYSHFIVLFLFINFFFYIYFLAGGGDIFFREAYNAILREGYSKDVWKMLIFKLVKENMYQVRLCFFFLFFSKI